MRVTGSRGALAVAGRSGGRALCAGRRGTAGGQRGAGDRGKARYGELRDAPFDLAG